MKITIPGKPIPKQRARHASRGKYVVTYDPQEKDKERVRQILTLQLAVLANSTNKLTSLELGKICRAKVFSVSFTFFLPLNQSDSVIAKNMKLWGITKASGKPDYDNLEKFYLDCANGVLWDDDAAVIQGKALKLFSEEPRVEIVINAVENMKMTQNVEKVIAQFSPSEFKEMQSYATQISQIAQPNLEEFEDSILEEWIVSTALLLSEFALIYASKLTKIAKIGDIKSEVKKLQEFSACVQSEV